MKIILIGGSGLIGRAFARELVDYHHEVWILSRNPGGITNEPGVNIRYWDGRSTDGWLDLVEKVDGLVNLVGESIGTRLWTITRKRQLLESRLTAGKVMVDAFNAVAKRPSVLVQASAIGFYGPGDNHAFTEDSPHGHDFLGDMAFLWENSTRQVEDLGVRRVIIRTGLVLDRHEGILQQFLLQARLFAGGPLGSGRQMISWIHIQDHVRAMRFLLEQADASGAYNLTSPNPVSNADFSRELARSIHRPYWFRVPGILLRLVLGEMSTLVLDGQVVLPQRLLVAGFTFTFPGLSEAMKDLFQGGA